MKKLMVAFAVVAVAAVAQAASVSWTCTNVKNTKGESAKGVAYVFFSQGDTRNSGAHPGTDALMSAILALEGKGATAVAEYMTGNSNFTYVNTTAGDFGHAAVDQVTDLGITSDGGKNYGAFAVIFDTETITDASNFYITTANYSQVYDDLSTNTKQFAIGNQTASATATNWHAVAVPEPTSGLLLLLGIGAMALRRRRA